MQSKAATVATYVDSLPADRKPAMIQIRKTILKNLPKGFEERMQYGMISYVVPLSLYKDGYHVTPGVPLPFIGLASQKNYISFYHMALHQGALLDWFTSEWGEFTRQKLDMGKACVRLKILDDLPLNLLGELCGKMTPQQWIGAYEQSIKNQKKKTK